MNDKQKTMAFVAAIKHNSIQEIESLINEGIDFDYVIGSGTFLKYEAGFEKDSDKKVVMLEMADEMTKNESFLGTDQSTPLICAVKYGDVDIVNLLLKNGVNVNTKVYEDYFGDGALERTALTYATIVDQAKIVRLLLHYKADPTIWDGKSPLYFAIKNDNRDIFSMLMDNGFGVNKPCCFHEDGMKSPLMVAIDHNNETIALDLLKNGADINKISDWDKIYGSSSFDYSLSSGMQSLAKHMLPKLDLSLRDSKGETIDTLLSQQLK